MKNLLGKCNIYNIHSLSSLSFFLITTNKLSSSLSLIITETPKGRFGTPYIKILKYAINFYSSAIYYVKFGKSAIYYSKFHGKIVALICFCCSYRKVSDQGISSWGWNLSGQHSTYHALFPRAWTIYDGMDMLYSDCLEKYSLSL